MQVSSLAKHVGIGGLAGGALGAGYGYATSDKNKSKAARRQRIVNAMGGGISGAFAGAHLGYGLHELKRIGRAGYRYAKSKAPPDHRPYLHHLDLSGNEKTKSEIIKKYREAAMKHHPDRPGGSESKMKDLNNAWDNIRRSSWFDKLASAGFIVGFRTTVL